MKRTILSLKQLIGFVLGISGCLLIIIIVPAWLWLVLLGVLLAWFGCILCRFY